MILTAPRDKDENVKNNNASNFIKCFTIPIIVIFDWRVWYQFVGKCIPHATKSFCYPRVNKFEFSGCQMNAVLFYLCTVYFLAHLLFSIVIRFKQSVKHRPYDSLPDFEICTVCFNST